MKAILCAEPGRLELVERAAPQPAEASEIRLKVSHIGICGTDYHIYEGKHPFLAYPRVMGHEISAHVMEAPAGSGLAPGDLVAVNPYIACGRCIACRRGKPNCCMAIEVLGVHRDGAFCEEIVVPSVNAYPAKGLSPEQAATVEFLAIGAHAVRRAGSVEPGARALVVGAGPIGLGTALFARIAGFEVTLMDLSEERLAEANGRFGLASSITVGPSALDQAKTITEGEGFEAVFDATGNAASMMAALPFVAHGGVLVYVSVVKDDITFADPEFHKREMSIIGSRNAQKADFDHVIASIRSGAIDTDQLITHRTDFSGAITDLPRWAHQKSGLIKAVIQAQG
ncbi:zinc-binding alcohol dehydrogenase family protein [Rhizobium sp. G21]|uniref:zinc-binding alcohol dehydrogenase family protein n=1 Tax=Rhizobium sp. G21 TaxID=2758439 RepID=UPI00160265D3|nr:zinc-binding alcohol dehydrogenase family protein [Rhizobium sp. G21]MBB1249478.1 zinc-binding alcohol dehydrogenase family protein [Rhizobium sp. G21]